MKIRIYLSCTHSFFEIGKWSTELTAKPWLITALNATPSGRTPTTIVSSQKQTGSKSNRLISHKVHYLNPTDVYVMSHWKKKDKWWRKCTTENGLVIEV